MIPASGPVGFWGKLTDWFNPYLTCFPTPELDENFDLEYTCIGNARFPVSHTQVSTTAPAPEISTTVPAPAYVSPLPVVSY
jgi:hypothetical protein